MHLQPVFWEAECAIVGCICMLPVCTFIAMLFAQYLYLYLFIYLYLYSNIHYNALRTEHNLQIRVCMLLVTLQLIVGTCGVYLLFVFVF